MPTPGDGSIRDATERYFRGELRDALVFAVWGALNLAAAALVLELLPSQRLLAIALATIGALQFLPGLWALRRHARRLTEARGEIARAPDAFRAGESDRLRRLLEARRRLRIADAAFFAAFVAVVWFAPAGERLVWLAVPGQMALLPLLNVAMERRARRFAEALGRNG